MSEFRLQQIGEQIRAEIAQMIVTEKIKDPRVSSFLSINKVVVSSDLSYARVYVSRIDNNEKKAKKGVVGLQSASGFIQTQLSKRLRIRQFPALKFFYDEGMKAGIEMVEKLNNLEITPQEELDKIPNNE
ncbi:MAG: 30S ribosome-binding factor RbfA [Treponemataceae bacterium]